LKNILILHGWGGSDNPHWQAWLADELKAKGYHVRFPSLDDRDLPTLDAWLTILHQEINYQKPDIIVTHSLGNMLYFHYQKKYGDLALEKLLLVAPVSQQCQIPELCEFFPYPTPIQNSTTLLVGSK
jgi:predicted alpha/beta hydrolase family esterase